jgi:allantoin racemase
MHIRVVTPVIPTGLTLQEHFDGILDPQHTVSFVEIEAGPISIETELDKAFATPQTIAQVRQAERDGVDAVVIDCMCDPGLMAARESVKIPVVGPCQAMMNLACTLGHKFSILSVAEPMRVIFESQAKAYGAWEKYASTRTIDIPVTQLSSATDDVSKAILAQSIDAIVSDGADVLVLGCTGFIGTASWLQTELNKKGYPVPVLDPIPTSMRLAKLLVDSGVTHSKVAYPTPSPKEIRGYEL